jgi:hypothetical protein
MEQLTADLLIYNFNDKLSVTVACKKWSLKNLIYTRYRIPKEQSNIDKPEKLESIAYTGWRQQNKDTTQYNCFS